ncbi:hypothetical protein DHEL01_v211612 [Diaporthe helianthi]|uniref:Uncharacterized protein n=1 Tax=Diaporthe helianthi TaxID=158607 RepID=A0A2P5HID1_DIAHE|nr:hypothetical protein DHEL01_v211612 [Diaporthe helianthi]
MGLKYKLQFAQSGLQRCLFDEAHGTGRNRVVCTVRLKFLKLHSIQSTPAFLPLKTQASVEGHSRHASVVKKAARPELRSPGSFNYPHSKLTYTFGEGTTPAGNTHLVEFGSSLPGLHLRAEKHIGAQVQSRKQVVPGTKAKDLKTPWPVLYNWHNER